MRFLVEAHPNIYSAGDYGALAAHAARCEALEAFGAVTQRFDPPSR